MKTSHVLLTVLLMGIYGFSFSQSNNNYDFRWNIIDTLIQKKNLPKSALAEVKKIYALASKDHNEAEKIKALIYEINLQNETREENEIASIKEIENEITTSSEPAKSILESMVAGLYWNYFQTQRFRLYNRTNTMNFNKKDIATWTAADFHKKITEKYLASIRNKEVLQKTEIKKFNAIISKGNVQYLRPTVYDLLAHEALDYFKVDETTISKPAYYFEIKDQEAFGNVETFSKYKFKTKDSLSTQFIALEILQNLILFHLKDPKPDALVDVDIERLQFVHNYSVLENKDALYENALMGMTGKWGKSSSITQAWYLLASIYNDRADEYKPLTDTLYRYERVKSKQITERIFKDSSLKNEGWVNSKNLFEQIIKKNVTVEVEKVNIPAQPFRALISYNNISSVNLKLISANRQLTKLYKEENSNFWNKIKSIKGINEWNQVLPTTNDFQQHSVEIKVNELPVGSYFIIATDDTASYQHADIISACFFQVSSLSYIQKANDLFVLDRQSGIPVNNAKLIIYNPDNRKEKPQVYTSGQNGFVTINNYNYNNHVNIYKENDSLIENTLPYYYNENTTKTTDRFIHFFTDRTLYRPGQTIYFKCLFIEKTIDNPSILTAYTTTLYLQNANGQVIDSLLVKTNEYGSVNGKFQLPVNTLNGNFSITDQKNHSVYFSVEEYKRPQFFIEYNKVKNTFKVEDTIGISGFAQSYAGNKIGGAIVKYRIVRTPIFSYINHETYSLVELSHGETKTDKEGNFNIHFIAKADKKIDPKNNPIFHYRIIADITDLNGETRSGQTTIDAGYHYLLLNMQIENKMATDSFNKLIILTQNLNKEFIPSLVEVEVIKLKPERRLVRSRYWNQPDQYLFSKEEFIHNFPQDEYKNESNFTTWAKDTVIIKKTDSTHADGSFLLPDLNKKSGVYKIIVTCNLKNDRLIKNEQFIELFDPAESNLPYPSYLWTKTVKNVIEPGQKAILAIGSSSEIHLIQEINKSNEPHSIYSTQSISNETKIIKMDADERDRGGYGVSYFFVRDNRFYSYEEIINVPWTNKKLTISYSTIRDKIIPGEKEIYTLKIKAYQNEKVNAEILAGMYDASLDQFKPFNWEMPAIYRSFYNYNHWQDQFDFGSENPFQKEKDIYQVEFNKNYDHFIFNKYFDLNERIGFSYAPLERRNLQAVAKFTTPVIKRDDAIKSQNSNSESNTGDSVTSVNNIDNSTVLIRKNLNETAFFYPDIYTDKDGNLEFSFTAPEALTTWKLQTFAHTKSLAFGYNEKEVITQKKLMVQPNMPRFLRAGDHIELSTKIVNLSDVELTGQIQLELIDVSNNQSTDGWFMNTFPNQYFTVGAKQSEVVKFPIQVPYDFTKMLQWRITARSIDSTKNQQTVYSDGEQNLIPVLTNKLLVTESLPMAMNGNGTRKFQFPSLLKLNNSESILHHSLTVEYTSNPAWYAVEALPYLMEFPYECAEQIWNRYYSNALASLIVHSSDRMQQIFQQWKLTDTAAFLSNLQKNQELKTILLEETPWVLAAQNEEQQKKNIGLLFDLVRMKEQLTANGEKLKKMQLPDGSFPWFQGGPADRYITQYILSGIGHLKILKALSDEQLVFFKPIINSALNYLDKSLLKEETISNRKKTDVNKNHLNYIVIQYLYMRSFFPDIAIPKPILSAYNYYLKQEQMFWMTQNKYMQGMIALSQFRNGNKSLAQNIISSLKQNAINNEELGMYWKSNESTGGWYWYNASIEAQALLIETFSEIGNNEKEIGQMKTWIIKNKQTNNWHTTKATAEACYAFLLEGSNWLNKEPIVHIQLGSKDIYNTDEKMEAGTGYFKKVIDAKDINSQMGTISLTVQQNAKQNDSVQTPSWGAVYWQYFEDMDKIHSSVTPLQLTKKLFIERNTDSGPKLFPIESETALHIGDKIIVRIELRCDRAMEYVHMKDWRASSFEPINVFSNYKWQDGLGYYESTKDASTDFFFDHINKGTYVFEYPLFVNQAGTFTSGIATIQCMYAPEFTAHSEGSKISVEEK